MSEGRQHKRFRSIIIIDSCGLRPFTGSLHVRFVAFAIIGCFIVWIRLLFCRFWVPEVVNWYIQLSLKIPDFLPLDCPVEDLYLNEIFTCD